MKAVIRIFIFLIFWVILISQAEADIIYLKNGRELKGVITREDNDRVELSVGFGAITLYRQEIDRVVRYSGNENRKIEQAWEGERLKKDEELKKLQEELSKAPREIEIERKGDHLYVNALLNGKISSKLVVDTGASFVVLSPDIGKKLGLDTENTKPETDTKTILANGKQVSVKLLKLDTMSVQNFEAKDIDAAIILDADAFEGFDGLLGMSFLKLFKFEINLEKSKLILQKN